MCTTNTLSKMAFKSVSVQLYVTISLILSVAGQSTNHLRCYVCESRDIPACEDPANVAIIPSVDCSSLVYSSPKEGDERRVAGDVLAGAENGEFEGSPIIREIFQGSERSLSSFRYACLKVTFTADGKRGTTRTCERFTDRIKDTCDFIRQDTNPKFKVHSCGSCNTDNCNSESFRDSSTCNGDDCGSGSMLYAPVLIIFCCNLLASLLRQLK